MRILNTYISKEFFRYLGVTLAAFVALYLVGDFIEKVDDYIEHKAAVLDVIAYVMYGLPNVLFLMSPVAVLLATLLSLGTLSRNGELIAMKASGIPLSRIVFPIVAFTGSLALIIFWANDSILPYCNSKAEYYRHVRIEGKPSVVTLKQDKFWFRGPKGEIINIGIIDPEKDIPVCLDVTFYKLDEHFSLVERVDAEFMEWTGEGWELMNGMKYVFGRSVGTKTEKFDKLGVDIPEKPEDFKRMSKLSQEMTFGELKRYIERLKAEGYNPTKFIVDMHGKVSFTLANLVMVLVAIPFSLRSSRSGGMAVSVGICVAVAISYWIIYSFSISLGHAGRFPPFFSAWVANLIFGFAGLFMLMHTDK
jgi:lipopolysaccharide export system permease protein